MRAFSYIGKQTLITVRVLPIRNVGTLDRSEFGCTRKHALRTIWNQIRYGRARYRFQQVSRHSADLASPGCKRPADGVSEEWEWPATYVIDRIVRPRQFRLCVEHRNPAVHPPDGDNRRIG